MNLIKQFVELKIKSYLNAEMNSSTKLWDFYQAYTMCLVAQNKNCDNIDLLNKIWKFYNNPISQKHKIYLIDIFNSRIFKNELGVIMDFLKSTKIEQNINKYDTLDFSDDGIIGIPSYIYNE